MTERLKEVKINFLPSEIEMLTEEAERQGISRSSLIRQRATQQAGNVSFDRQSYAKAVEAAAKTVPGIPRAQLEHAVAKVITTIAA